MYKSKIETRSRNHCCCGKTISIIYSESVPAALSIQLVLQKRHIVFSAVACLTIPHSYTVSPKWLNFRKDVTEHKMCVVIFSGTFF